MSDQSQWSQKMLQEQLGIRTAVAVAPGPQEGIVTAVGTANISMDGGPAIEMDVVWFHLPNTVGEGVGFGPAPYEPVLGWIPSVGDPVLALFVGNGYGRPYVVEFPTAAPDAVGLGLPSGGTPGQSVVNIGSGIGSWESAIPLFIRDAAISGTPPAAPGPFLVIAGAQVVTYSSGTGTLVFPGGGFPNGLLCLLCGSDTASLGVTTTATNESKVAANIILAINGVGFTGANSLNYFAVGW